MMRPECGRRPNEKARDRFPGAGCCDFCDDEQMPVICPTCQLLFKARQTIGACDRNIDHEGSGERAPIEPAQTCWRRQN
jgi:hypothetical protein